MTQRTNLFLPDRMVTVRFSDMRK